VVCEGDNSLFAFQFVQRIKDRIGWDGPDARYDTGALRLFRLRREVAALGEEVSLTATKFGEDIFQDTEQAIPGVLWFFGVFPDFVCI
jgi:hypothetical protein